MSRTSKSFAVLLIGLISAIGAGCGGGGQPALGEVTGRVTLDGKPLAGAIIMASPEVGRPGTATLDSDGKYVLKYTEGVEGTKLGRNKISFVWPTDVSGPRIPAKYAEKSELVIDVKKGTNTFDFPLESEAGAASGNAQAPAKTPGKAKPAPLD